METATSGGRPGSKLPCASGNCLRSRMSNRTGAVSGEGRPGIGPPGIAAGKSRGRTLPSSRRAQARAADTMPLRASSRPCSSQACQARSSCSASGASLWVRASQRR
jgi:hypothetical protein